MTRTRHETLRLLQTALLSVGVLLLVAACGPGQGGDPTAGDAASIEFGENDEAARLFDPNVVHTFEIEISEENLAYLDESPSREEYVEATLLFEGERIEPVGLRYKGGIGSFQGCVERGPNGFLDVSGRKICPKLGMKVSFNRFVEEGRWMGLKKLQFHAMNQDPTQLKERLNYNLFQEFGVASSRANHARLVINGEYAGLFVLIEQLDSRFLESRFDKIEGGEGNLYKDLWPGGLASLGVPSIGPGQGGYDGALRTNRSDPNMTHDTMINFATQFQAAIERGPDEVDRVVDAWMDIDYVLRWIAVERAIQHDDGPMHLFAPGQPGTDFTGVFFNHNFYWYAAREESWLVPIPWDLDLTLGGPTTGWVQVEWNDLDAECVLMEPLLPFLPLPPDVPSSCEPLIRSWARRADAYRETVQALLDGPFSEAAMTTKLDRLRIHLRPYITEAAENGFGPEFEAWEERVDGLEAYLAGRREDLALSIMD